MELESANCETQLHSYSQQTPLKLLSPMTPSPSNVVELPYQQTISTLRDMLRTERDEKAAVVEQIQINAQRREEEHNRRLEQLIKERKKLESELNEVRLSMAQQKVKSNAEITKIREKLQILQSELEEKEKRNTECMENMVTKLTADHKKEIAEHAQRIRQLEKMPSTKNKREQVILQFGEKPSAQIRRC